MQGNLRQKIHYPFKLDMHYMLQHSLSVYDVLLYAICDVKEDIRPNLPSYKSGIGAVLLINFILTYYLAVCFEYLDNVGRTNPRLRIVLVHISL